MDESISVPSIFYNLPPSWKDFKNMLKYKKENISLIELGSHLPIEVDILAQEKGKE